MKCVMLLCSVLVLSGCAFLEPKPIVKYDAKCQIHFQQYTLGIADNPGKGVVLNDDEILVSSSYYSLLQDCSGNGCLELVRKLMQSLAIDVLFAGTVAIAGNTISWMQKEQDCKEIEPGKAAVVEEDLGKIN